MSVQNLEERKRQFSEAKQQLLSQLLTPGAAIALPSFAIPRRPKEDRYPLAASQRQLWFLNYSEPELPFYGISRIFRLRGPLSAGALESSLAELCRRHGILRTTFGLHDNEPMQMVADEINIPFFQIDLTAIASETRERILADISAGEFRQAFDLEKGPLTRVALVGVGDEDHMLIVSMHRIVIDDGSMSIFLRELSQVYEAHLSGVNPASRGATIEYTDFASWQKELPGTDEFSARLAYWKEKLAGISPGLNLPFEKAEPRKRISCSSSLSVFIPGVEAEEIEALAKAEGCSLFVVLLAALEILLARYTGQDEILIGTEIPDRHRQELEPLIGPLTNTLVLRSAVCRDSSLRQVLKQVNDVVLEAHSNRDLPFEFLLEDLQPERPGLYSPLFHVSIALRSNPDDRFSLTNVQSQSIPVEGAAATVDLSFVAERNAAGLNTVVQYKTDLFDESIIKSMAAHYRRLLESLVATPDCTVSRVPLLTDEERQQILVGWNETAREFPREKTIHELFEQQVIRTPDVIAVIDEHQHLTYRELNGRANRLAHYLAALGVGPEAPVGIFFERSVDMIVSLMGVLKAGAAYLPLDPGHPPQRVEQLIAEAETAVVVTRRMLATRLGSQAERAVVLNDEDVRRTIEEQSSENPSNGVTAENLAYLIYTSGSTGTPKCVMIEHRSVLNLAEALSDAIYKDSVSETRRISLNAALTFDASVQQIVQLIYGRTLCILPEEARTDAAAFAEFCQRTDLNVLDCTPSQLAGFLAYGLFEKDSHAPGTVLVGGEAIPPRLWSRLIENKETAFHNVYGPTECTVDAISLRLAPLHPRPLIGRPLANTRAYVLDPEMEPAPAGATGELYLGEAGLARGYLDRPELTAERFVPDPFGSKPGKRLYRTGDSVRWDSHGAIEFLGRIDQQVKIRGNRIELGEIEATLGRHEKVKQCAVVMREDEHGEKRLIGFVAATGETLPRADELRQFLQQKLPGYMVPNAFVMLERLPLSASGKVDRKALPAHDGELLRRSEKQSLPRDGTELYLKALWEDVLGISDIGIDDNFFDLGGHSLMAMILAAQTERAFKRKLSVQSIFEYPTIKEMAAFIRQSLTFSPPSSVIPLQRRGALRPFFCVHSGGGLVNCYMTLARCLGLRQPFYGLQSYGLDDTHEPVTRIEEMAELYIRDMQETQPAGPYQIGGWCLGGTVAYEMARQLNAKGATVSVLAIFDEIPNFRPVLEPLTIADVDSAERARIADILAGRGMSPEQIESLGFERQLELFLQSYKASGNIPADVAVEQCRRFLRIWVTNNEARKRYHYKPFPGRITLFRSGLSQPDAKTPGWAELALGGLDVHEFPVGHDQFMDEPCVRSVAETLTLCLDALTYSVNPASTSAAV